MGGTTSISPLSRSTRLPPPSPNPPHHYIQYINVLLLIGEQHDISSSMGGTTSISPLSRSTRLLHPPPPPPPPKSPHHYIQYINVLLLIGEQQDISSSMGGTTSISPLSRSTRLLPPHLQPRTTIFSILMSYF